MLELKYRNAFKEVDEILKYTDIDLVNRIPKKFISFLREHMNNDYEFYVQEGLSLNKQNLSEEASNVFALIYRDYWATEEEKEELRKKDEEERKLEEEKLLNIFNKGKSNYVKKSDNIEGNKELIIIENESLIKKIGKWLRKIFSRK